MTTSPMPVTPCPIVLPVFLTTEQTRIRLGISRTTLWRYIAKGLLHPRRTFRDLRSNIFVEHEVDALLVPRPVDGLTSCPIDTAISQPVGAKGICHDCNA